MSDEVAAAKLLVDLKCHDEPFVGFVCSPLHLSGCQPFHAVCDVCGQPGVTKKEQSDAR